MLLLINLATVSACFADPGDGLCDGNDGGPDGCPLDTWVWVLVVVVVVLAVLKMMANTPIRDIDGPVKSD